MVEESKNLKLLVIMSGSIITWYKNFILFSEYVSLRVGSEPPKSFSLLGLAFSSYPYYLCLLFFTVIIFALLVCAMINHELILQLSIIGYINQTWHKIA